jgi:hypothetical protein
MLMIALSYTRAIMRGSRISIAIAAPRQHLLWLLLFAFTLNERSPEPRGERRSRGFSDHDAWLCRGDNGGAMVPQPPVLHPAYAFYAFYPIHLLLALINTAR